MIALNEIVSKKALFEQKYKLMNKRFNLDKIIKLEKEFIVLDRKANELRATCNKLCSEVANLIEKNKDSQDAICKINSIDKEITCITKKSQKAMKKINSKLRKLPNVPLDENVLNISIKTKNQELTKEDFLSRLSEFAKIEKVNLSEKAYINSLKKLVFKAEHLPKLMQIKSNFLLFCGEKSLEFLNNIQDTLTTHAKYLVLKSIKNLRHESSKEFLATLSDKTSISVEFLGEYVSREKSIKFYDKNLDMTRFVNIIRITIR